MFQSDDYILTQNDLDNWITVPFDEGKDLYAGTSYLAVVGGYANPVDTFKVNVSGESQGAFVGFKIMVVILVLVVMSWYWISDIPMIRMSFDPSVLSNDNIISGEFNIYPNPTTGILTVELNNLELDNYKISISNVLGQEVYIQ